MTSIINSANTIKTKSAGKVWKQKLTEQWKVEQTIKKVDREILLVITEKCLGNPLISLQYFVNMLHNDVIKVENTGFVVPTEKFH